MEKDTEKTKMIFRMWGTNVIAIMPELAGDYDPATCTSYMHIGQHGACSPDMIIESSRPATEEELKPLYDELTNLGYNIQIIKRLRYDFYQTRKREIAYYD